MTKASKKLFKKVPKKSIKKTRKKTRKKTVRKRQFLYNPDDTKKSFDVYIDKNPKDTINIKYKTIDDVNNTIRKLEQLYKNKEYTHKRIWQVGMIMKVRLEVLKNKKPKEYNLAKMYFDFLGKRTKMNDKERYKATFKKSIRKTAKKSRDGMLTQKRPLSETENGTPIKEPSKKKTDTKPTPPTQNLIRQKIKSEEKINKLKQKLGISKHFQEYGNDNIFSSCFAENAEYIEKPNTTNYSKYHHGEVVSKVTFTRDSFEFLGDRVLKYIHGLYSFTNSYSFPKTSSQKMTEFIVELEKNSNFNCYFRYGIADEDICMLMNITSNEKKCADLFESLVGTIFYYYHFKKNQDETTVIKKIIDWLKDYTPFEDNVDFIKKTQHSTEKSGDDKQTASFKFCEKLKNNRKKIQEENEKKKISEEEYDKRQQRLLRFAKK